MNNISDLIGKIAKVSYPTIKQHDIIFKLGKNIVVFIDAFSRHFDYGFEGDLLNAEEFYSKEFVESLTFTDSILCKIESEGEYILCFKEIDSNTNIYAVNNKYEITCKDYEKEIVIEEKFLENLLN